VTKHGAVIKYYPVAYFGQLTFGRTICVSVTNTVLDLLGTGEHHEQAPLAYKLKILQVT